MIKCSLSVLPIPLNFLTLNKLGLSKEPTRRILKGTHLTPMSMDSSSFKPSKPVQVPSGFYPFRSTSRRGFIKALIALAGAFSIGRYFKWGQPSVQGSATRLAQVKTRLVDKRAVAYTPQSPLKKTNA